MKLLDKLGGSILGPVSEIIDNLTTSGEEKLAAKHKLMELELGYRAKILEAEQAWVVAQADVIKTEAGSSQWLAANWRPILMLTFTYIIAHNYVFAPLFSIQSVPIPDNMWELLKLGVGGYIFGRSGEKIAKTLRKK